MDDNQILEIIQQIFEEETGDTSTKLSMNTKLYDIPNVSSFTLIQIIAGIEDRFGIEIPNRVLITFNQMKSLVSYIKRSI